ncbi:MAG TPA: hypothetical protein VHD56_01820 [Tepidisphaeraceae bacterium]|nr:hypothetical protein [Tepidisphaeraceae bacterium]
MRIDKSHQSWLFLSIAILLIAGGWYWYDVTRGHDALNGPSGGSATGLIYGVLGTSFMLFAGLLGARKKVRTWRIGRAEFWMRGHLWLGTLALPMIWLHAGFRHGGLLTSILTWLTYIIVVSGIIGALFQHLIPNAMTRSVPDETIFEQIPQVLRHLAVEADDVAAICGPENGQDIETWRKARTSALRTRSTRALMTEERRDQLAAALATAPADGSAPLKEFYLRQVKPFVIGESDQPPLNDPTRASTLFAKQKVLLPQPLHETLDDLERICDEVRQLHAQRRMHHWLHGWLFIHVPLSMALLVLTIAHVIVSLRYW